MGIWSDLWTGGGGITQDLYNEKFEPQVSYEPIPQSPEVYTPFNEFSYPTSDPYVPQDEFANFEFFQPFDNPNPDITVPAWQDSNHDADFGDVWGAVGNAFEPFRAENSPFALGPEGFNAANTFNFDHDRWQDREFGNFEQDPVGLLDRFENRPGGVPFEGNFVDQPRPEMGFPVFGGGLWGSNSLRPSTEGLGFPELDGSQFGQFTDALDTGFGAGGQAPGTFAAEDDFASTMAAYQPPQPFAYPNEAETFADWGAAYQQEGVQPSWVDYLREGVGGEDMPAGRELDHYFKSMAERGRWTPDQFVEQLENPPTVNQWLEWAIDEEERVKLAEQERAALIEHEQLTPRFGGLEDIYNTIAPADSPAAQEERDYLKGLSDKELFGYGADTAEWKSQLTEHALNPLEAIGLVGSIPGQLVEKGLSYLPESVPEPFAVGAVNPLLGAASYAMGRGDEDVTNPLANDYFAESLAAPMANVLVGAALLGTPGAFLGGMAPVWRPDEETGMSAWDQMDWKQRALTVGTNILNAKLITRGNAIETAIGGETALGRTAAGIAINALTPLSVAGWQEILGEDVDWKMVAEQAVIWGGVRGLMGVAPILREQQKVAVPDPSTAFGQTPEGEFLYADTMDIRRRELPRYQRALSAAEEEMDIQLLRQADSIDTTATEIPANQLLIAKLASEYRGETPPDAFNAVRQVVDDFPEAEPSMALTVKLGMEVAESPTVPHVGEPTILNAARGSDQPTYGPMAPRRWDMERQEDIVAPANKGSTPVALVGVVNELLSGNTAMPDATLRFRAVGPSDPSVVVSYDDLEDKVAITVDTPKAIREAKAYLEKAGLPTDAATLAYMSAVVIRASTLYSLAGPTAQTPSDMKSRQYAYDAAAVVNMGNAEAQVMALADAVMKDIQANPKLAEITPAQRATEAPYRTERLGEVTENSVFPVSTGLAVSGAAAEVMSRRVWSPEIAPIFDEAMRTVSAIANQLGTGVPADVDFRGWQAEEHLLAVNRSDQGRYGGVFADPLHIARNTITLFPKSFRDTPEKEAQVIAQHIALTMLHEATHSGTRRGDFADAAFGAGGHEEDFTLSFGISSSGAAGALYELANTMRDKLLASPHWKEFLHDAAVYNPSTNYIGGTPPTFEPAAGRPGQGAGGVTRTEAGAQPLGEPLGGTSPEVYERVVPERGGQASAPVDASGTGERGVRDLAARDEPGSALVRRPDGEPADVGGAVRTGEPERGVREPGTTEPGRDAEAAADQVGKEEEPKYESGRSQEEEGKARGWGTINEEEGSAISAFASHLLSPAAGIAAGYYGYSKGDTEEEKLKNAAIYGAVGFLGASVISGGAMWRAQRVLRGKATQLPEPGKSATMVITPEAMMTWRKMMGPLVEHVPDAELELFIKAAMLNTRAAENQQIIIDGVNAPIVALRKMLTAAFGHPDAGSTKEVLKTSQMQVIGHYEHMVDATNRHIKEIYDVTSQLLDTPEKRLRFMLAFEQPVRWAHALEDEATQFVAYGMSTVLNEWGALMAEAGMLNSASIINPDGWMLQDGNYITHIYSHLNPLEKLEVLKGSGAGFSKADIEKARDYNTLADAIMFGLVPKDIDPTAILSRYVRVASRRLIANAQMQQVSELAQDADNVFISESEYKEFAKHAETVYKLADYVRIDSPLFRNRVNPNDSKFLINTQKALHDALVQYRRFNRLAGAHGRKAKDSENRAFKAAERMSMLEEQLLKQTGTKEELTQARNSLLAELRAQGGTTLADIVQAAGRRGRAGVQSQDAALSFARIQSQLEATLRALDKLDRQAPAIAPEPRHPRAGRAGRPDTQPGGVTPDEAEAPTDYDAIALSTIKEVMHDLDDEARELLGENREPEISSLAFDDEAYEKAAAAYERKEAKREAAAAAKAHEEELIADYRKSLKLQSKADDLDLTETDFKIAKLEGQLKELEALIQRDMRKALGSGSKALGHEEREAEYRTYMEETVRLIDAVKGIIKPVKDKVALDREPLMVRVDVADLFNWTKRDATKDHKSVVEAMRFHSKWVNTLLSGPVDYFMIGVSIASQMTQAATGQVSPKRAVEITGSAMKQAVLAQGSPRFFETIHMPTFGRDGNQAWWEHNKSWIEAIRKGGGGLEQRTGDEFFATEDEIETLLGWVPVLGSRYERLVKATTRAQFSGALPVFKVENIRARFYRNMANVLREKGFGAEGKDLDAELLSLAREDGGAGASPATLRQDFSKVAAAYRSLGVSQRELDTAMEEASRVMDMVYGGRNWKISDIPPTAQSILRIVLLAPNWFLTRANLFGTAFKDLAMTPVQLGENVVEGVANLGHRLQGDGAYYQRKTPHPFDLASQPGKDWALGTALFAVTGLVLGLIGMSTATESWEKKKLAGPDWKWIEDELKQAFTDPAHLLEVRDPWTGAYWGPLTWQKDFLRVGIAAYYMAQGDEDMAWETLGSYGKARLGPLPRGVWNLILGRNFAGKKISPEGKGPDDPQWVQDQALNFLKENQPQFFSETEKALPLEKSFTGDTLGQMLGMGYENPIFAIMNMMGLGRARTQTPLDKAFWEAHEAKNPDGTPKYPDMQDARNYYQLDPAAKKRFLEDQPDSIRDYIRSGLPAEYKAATQEQLQNVDNLTGYAFAGKRNGDSYYFSKYRDEMKVLGAEARGASGQLGFPDKEGGSEEERLLQSYYKLFDEASPNGVLDGALFNDLFEGWAAEHDAEDIKYVFDYGQLGDPLPMQQYSRAIQELKNMGAFDTPRHDPKKFKSGKNEEEMTAIMNDTKQAIYADGGDSVGYTAMMLHWRDEWGLPDKGPLSTEQSNFLNDLKLVSGQPTNKAYISMREDHPGLFSWLKQDITYAGILGQMAREPEKYRRSVLDE